jgi:hypothetical protein
MLVTGASAEVKRKQFMIESFLRCKASLQERQGVLLQRRAALLLAGAGVPCCTDTATAAEAMPLATTTS